MIIIRYLIRETLKRQLAILLILLAIFFCQKLVKVLGGAIHGIIPKNMVLFLLGFGLPEMAKLILPLSLFLSLLITFTKLYNESEIIAMHACGLGKTVLVKVALLLALITSIVSAINVLWAGPFILRYQDSVLSVAKENLGIAALTEGQFRQSIDGNSVLFVGRIDGSYFNDIFLAQLHPRGNTQPSVLVGDYGQLMRRKDGSQIVTINKGTRFEGSAFFRNFRITNFQNYQSVIGHQAVVSCDSSDAEKMDIYALFRINTNHARAEFHWRITLIFTVFVMALMVVPISEENSRKGRIFLIFPSILSYLLFFLLQSIIKSNGEKGKLDPLVWTWIVNSFYLVFAVGLNLWNLVPIRRLRARLTHGGIFF